MTMFDNLFILDIANNHQGDIEHGQKIIESLGEVVRELNCAGKASAMGADVMHLA